MVETIDHVRFQTSQGTLFFCDGNHTITDAHGIFCTTRQQEYCCFNGQRQHKTYSKDDSHEVTALLLRCSQRIAVVSHLKTFS